MLDFLPAEAARVVGDMPPADRKASLALLDNRLAGDNGNPGTVAQLDQEWKAMQSHIGETMSGWHVYERAHGKRTTRKSASTGTRLRNWINRWYLWPTVRRQIDYNASLARTVRELSRQLAEVQAKLGVQALLTSGLISKQAGATSEDISIELEDLRARLEALERKT
jgi:hypothetical protein